jgi:predicted RNA-binding Zn-ribbon protein involved in translation (DUF1610 family)
MEKNFMVRCHKCRWARLSTGLSSDLADLKEIISCPTCGKARQFKCPKCGLVAKLTRVKRTDG